MSALMDALMGLISGAGAVLDTPGSIVRNSLAGENPLKGLFDPEERTSGREMLQSWGVSGENDPDKWFEGGDIAGFGAELVTDPLNLLGAGLLSKAKAARVPKYKPNPNILDEIVAAKQAEISNPQMAEELSAELSRLSSLGEQVKKQNKPWLINSMETAVRDPKFGPESSYYKNNLESLRHFMPEQADELVETLGKYPANLGENLHPFHDVMFDLGEKLGVAKGKSDDIIGAEMLMEALKKSPDLQRVLERIQPGSSMLGAGAESMALRTPKGDVLKIHGKNAFDTSPQAIPPNIPEVLQPNSFVNFDEFSVGRYPMAETGGISDEMAEMLEKAIGEKGYPAFDVDPRNIGIHQGRPVVIDAGSVGYPEGMRPKPVRDPRLAPLLMALLANNAAQTAGGY